MIAFAQQELRTFRSAFLTMMLTPLAAAAVAGSAAAQSAEPRSLFSGSYSCAQGSTHLNLTIIGKARGSVKAQFDFVVPQTGQPGSYLMYGMVGPEGQTALYPDRWLIKPNGYQMVGLSGNLSSDGRDLTGIITATGCRQFVVRLSEGAPLLAVAQPSALAPRLTPPVSATANLPAQPARSAAPTAQPTKPIPAPTAKIASQTSQAAVGALPITAETMPGVLIRELDDVNQRTNAYAIMGEMLGIPKMAKINDNEGSWYLRNMDGSSGLYDFDVRNVNCTYLKGRSDAQSCTYDVSALVELVLPIVGVQSGRSPFVRRTDQFTRTGSRWTSATLRAAMVSGLKAPTHSGTSAGSDPSSRLCRALGAGVAATVGSAQSVKTYRAAGC